MDKAALKITVAGRIKKYRPGDDPETCEPFEIVEQEPFVLEGEDALKFMQKMKGGS